VNACTNCGADAADVYCARCGERQPGHHDLSVAHFAHDVVHEFVHLDSKVLRTLRDLVTRPGFLTAEYFAGRKSRYIPPLRLFLTLFALQFLAFTFYKPAAMYTVSTMRRFDSAGALSTLLEHAARHQHVTTAEIDERVDMRWHKYYSLLQLANIVGVALVLKVLYHRRYLAEHLVFAAHFLAFSYIGTLVLVWPVYALYGVHPGALQKVLSAANIAIQLAYLFLGQRRFYASGTGATTIKTVLLWAGRAAVTMILLGGSLAAAILSYR
jgi:hypothetical protein